MLNVKNALNLTKRWAVTYGWPLMAAITFSNIRINQSIEPFKRTLTFFYPQYVSQHHCVPWAFPGPLGSRVLWPYLCQVISHVFDILPSTLLLSSEILFMFLLSISWTKILEQFIQPNMASVYSFFGLVLLSIVYSMAPSHPNTSYPLFFAFDMVSAAVLGWGCYFAIKNDKWLLALLILVGTWNRETTLLLIPFYTLVHIDKQPLKPLLLTATGLFVSWLAVKVSIALLTPYLSNLFMHGKLDVPLLRLNFSWLLHNGHATLFMVGTGFLLPAWWCFRKWVPLQLQHTRYVGYMYLIILSFVGIFQESRVFIDFFVISFCPVIIGVHTWATGGPPSTTETQLAAYLRILFKVVLLASLIQLYMLQQQPINIEKSKKQEGCLIKDQQDWFLYHIKQTPGTLLRLKPGLFKFC